MHLQKNTSSVHACTVTDINDKRLHYTIHQFWYPPIFDMIESITSMLPKPMYIKMQAFEKYWVLNSWKWRFFNFWNRNGQKRGVSWWFSVDVRFPNHDWINQLIKISRPRLGFSTRRININIIFVNSMTDILRLPMKMIAKKNKRSNTCLHYFINFTRFLTFWKCYFPSETHVHLFLF